MAVITVGSPEETDLSVELGLKQEILVRRGNYERFYFDERSYSYFQ